MVHEETQGIVVEQAAPGALATVAAVAAVVLVGLLRLLRVCWETTVTPLPDPAVLVVLEERSRTLC